MSRSKAKLSRHIRWIAARVVGLGALLGGLVAPSEPAAAQGAPTVFYFCYVKGSGTVYRIMVPGAPDDCNGAGHTPFSWTDGANALLVGAAAGGDLSGTFPNPTVAKLAGIGFSATAPTSGQVLT